MKEENEPGTAKKPREVSSRELLGTEREIVIVHNGERYTLRLTVNNKLILTK
jgi:hemin uptake protein HemP